MSQPERALVAMSGGVDSSVALRLVRERGYEALGVTMRLFDGPGPERERADAAAAAARMGVPFEVADLREVFRREVMEKFRRVYESGGTPNPCVDCNRALKFGALLALADERGADKLVTGHYARVERQGETGRFLLLRALDSAKDQSYVLYALTQEQLRRVLFPLGELTKEAVRALAAEAGLKNAQKRDSQDICFIPDGDYGAFLERFRGEAYPAGDFVDETGRVLGRHRGAVRYTLGQRRGLGLPMGDRVYVVGKDMARNTVTVGTEAPLFSRELLAEEVHYIPFDELTEPLRVTAKTRYRQKDTPATLYPAGEGTVRVVFDEPQRAVTAGQAAVFYDGFVVVGGGTIREVIR